MRGLLKGITLAGRFSANSFMMGLQIGLQKTKFCKIFASERGSKSGIMRGIQKGTTIGAGPLEVPEELPVVVVVVGV